MWALVVFDDTDGHEDSEGVRLSLSLLGEGAPGLSVVDALARLQVLCGRSGVRMHLEHVHSQLDDLLELTGLRREMIGESERTKETLGIEEGVDARDAVT